MGLPDLAKPFTLYVTEKDKVAMGVLSQIMGTWDRLVTLISWTMLPLGGRDSYRQLLQLSYWFGGNQADFGPRFDGKSPA